MSNQHLQITHLVDEIHCMDCIQLMKTIPTNSISMVFADPPFNLKKKYNTYNDNIPFDEYMEWTAQWIRQAYRILRTDGSIFIYNIPRILTHTTSILNQIAVFRHWIAWNSNGQPLGKTLNPAHYGILFYSKSENAQFNVVRAPHKTCRSCMEYIKDYGGKKHLRHPFGYQISDVWDDIHRLRHPSKRIYSHPCQLPVHLMERMILMTTDEGDVIFDLFCGGGSCAVASKQMGRKYLGAEIDSGYCNVAKQKLHEAKPTMQNGKYVSIHRNKIVSIRDVDLVAE